MNNAPNDAIARAAAADPQAELDRFANIVSHELRQPLSAIIGFAELLNLRCRDALDADGIAYLQYISEGAESMRALLSALLTYARVTTRGQPFAPVDLDQLAKDVLARRQPLLQDVGASVTRTPLPHVHGDAAQLEMVLERLLDNAVKFRRPGIAPAIRLSAEETDGGWTLRVEDNGIGIPAAERERVFVIFQRLHPDQFPGTGASLAVCRRITERHGGRIWLEESPAGGCTVLFTLPRPPAPSAESPPSQPPPGGAP